MSDGPSNSFCAQLHEEKYRQPGESFRECMNRVASALSDDPIHYRMFRETLLKMRFLPGGRIQATVGTTRSATPYNCYVSGPIADSFVAGDGCIMQRATEAAATMRMGGGIGYDFSTLRPRGALIKKLNSKSTGPVSFMHVFDGLGTCTASTGDRRGAQMGVLRVDHPDIEEFIRVKHNADKLTRFNLSIAATDEFMQAVITQKPFDLKFNGEVHQTVDAAELWETVMRSTWDWAEPGILFIDQINRMNNLYYCETIAATNPCAEQPLPPFGACLLGSFNLTKYLTPSNDFDYGQMAADIPHVVRAMDNVVDVARYPLPQQETEAKNKRRMGLGVFGLANCIEAMGFTYGSPEFLVQEANILAFIRDESYRASAEIAKEKGAFPLYDERYLAGHFVKQLPEDVLAAIRLYGIRNSHLTSIAPTGTISQCADQASSGIEPVFDYISQRAVNMSDGPTVVRVEDYGVAHLGVHGKRCRDVTVDEHVAVLLTAQKYVDSAVSKTCNVPADTPWTEFTGVYQRAWEGGAKGCTTYQLGCKRGAVLTEVSAAAENKPEACVYDPSTGNRTCE